MTWLMETSKKLGIKISTKRSLKKSKLHQKRINLIEKADSIILMMNKKIIAVMNIKSLK